MRDFKSIDKYLMDIAEIMEDGKVTKDENGIEYVILDIDKKIKDDICEILYYLYSIRKD